jgi:hypothetical protein
MTSTCFGPRTMCEEGRDHDGKVPNAKSVSACFRRSFASCFYLGNTMHCYESFGECSAVAEVWQPNNGCNNYDEYDLPSSAKRPRRGSR